MVEVEQQEGVAVVTMARPKVNALSPAFAAALREVIEQVQADEKTRALVIASRYESVFSAGLDLQELHEVDREGFLRFMADFAAIQRLLVAGPAPSIAAVGGHALAGGMIIAMACDRRVAATGMYGLGLPEIELGLPVPGSALAVLQRVAGERAASEMAMTGRTYRPEEARALGVLDRLVAPETVLEQALAEARVLASKSRAALHAIRGLIKGDFAEQLAARDTEEIPAFADFWFSDAAIRARQRFLERSQRT